MTNGIAPITLLRKHSVPAGLFILTVLTRLPFTSKFLYSLDSGQYALALDHYDISLHTPHPPGYFLYIMLGRLANSVIGEGNSALISLSIAFSGLVVVMVYYLGREVFDEETGIVAAVIAITSPLLWFFGEVAQSYMAEAFMSVLFAYLCYRTLMVDGRYNLLSAVALGIAGGFRQNTMVFLIPLWLYSMKDIGIKRIILNLMLFGITVLVWFLPMLQATGGYNVYSSYLDAHWKDSIWRGIHLSLITDYTFYAFYFIMCGLGVAIAPLLATAYFSLRRKVRPSASRTTIIFFLLWLLPGFLFHVIIYNSPAPPASGYTLIFLVGLLLLAGRALVAFFIYHAPDFQSLHAGKVMAIIVIFIAAVNSTIFLFHPFPFSLKGIREHDKLVSKYIEAVRNNFSPADTEVIGTNFFDLSYRHAMYYLPEYRVYNDYFISSPEGPKLFCGQNKMTHRTSYISLLPSTRHVVFFINHGPDKLGILPPSAGFISVPGGDVLVHFESTEDLYRVPKMAYLFDPAMKGR